MISGSRMANAAPDDRAREVEEGGGGGDGGDGGGGGGVGTFPAHAPTHQESSSNQSSEQEQDGMWTSIAGVVGNALEWYDFATFGYFSDIIGDEFFPPDQKGHNALIESFVVFGAAFLVRPIGAAVIGRMGDTVGRKSALETSVLLMAIPTFALGCLPSYSTAGWGATILLVLCRLLQGLSVGGQLMSSVVFTLERTHVSKWGLWGSSVFMFASVGTTLGSLLSYILRERLTDDQLHSWGWRVPFLFGILGIIPGLYLKRHAKEHGGNQLRDTTAAAESSGVPERPDVLEQVIHVSNRRALLSSALVPALPAATYYIVMIWMAIFMETIVNPPVPHAFAINSAVGLIGGIGFCLLGGYLADRFTGGWTKQMIASAISLAVLSPLLLHFVGKGDPVVAFFSQMTLVFFLSTWNGAMIPWIVACFPENVRLTSVSIGYNIAVSICGGFSPALATFLVDTFNSAAPGFVVTVLAAVSIFGLWIAPKTDVHSGIASQQQQQQQQNIQSNNATAETELTETDHKII